MNKKLKKPVNLIAAITPNRVIGDKGRIPWHISEDLRLFKSITQENTVIMGRKTFEGIGKPLPGRKNIVISKTLSAAEGVIVFDNMQDALCFAEELPGKIFVIGGASVYEQALPIADYLFISHINSGYEGDAFFPFIDPSRWKKVREEPYPEFVFRVYKRIDTSRS